MGRCVDGLWTIDVKYKQRNGRGRYTAIRGIGQQCMERHIRHTIGGDFYDDIDMVNAHPVLLVQLCARLDIPCRWLTHFVENRDSILADIMRDNDVGRDAAKQAILSKLNGGSMDWDKLAQRTPWMDKFADEVDLIHLAFTKAYADEWAAFTVPQNKNKLGSFMNGYLCDAENECLQAMLAHFVEIGAVVNNCVLAYDGIQIPKDPARDNEALIAGAQAAITARTKFVVRLKVKAMDTRLALPHDVPQYIGFSISTYSDYNGFARKTVSEGTVRAWAANTIALIENGGNQMMLTRNATIDYKTQERTIKFEYVPPVSLLHALRVSVQIPSDTYDVEAADRYALEEKKKGCDRDKQLMGRLRPKTKPLAAENLREYMKMMMLERLVPCYDSVQFQPFLARRHPEGVDLYRSFNLWTGFPLELEPLPEDIVQFPNSLVFKHVRDELMNGDVGEFEHWLACLADMVQCPGEMRSVSHVFSSRQGCGKGLLAEFVASILGRDHVMTFNDMESYLSRFNVDQQNKILKIFEEVSDRGAAFANHDKIKADQAAPTIRIEVKGGAVTTVNNFARMWFFSNNEDILYTEADDRRNTYHRANPRHANDTAYFAPIWAEIRDKEFQRAAFEWLAEYKYDEAVVVRPYATAYKRDQKITNMSAPLRFMIFMAAKEWPGLYPEEGTVGTNDLWNTFKSWREDAGMSGRYNQRPKFFKEIEKLGITKARGYINGKRTTYIHTDGVLDKFRSHLCDPTFTFDMVGADVY